MPRANTRLARRFTLRKRFSRRTVEDLAQLIRQDGRGERLLQEAAFRTQQPVAKHGVVGITAHENNRQAGDALTSDLGQFAAAHVGHDRVGDQQVDFGRVVVQQLQGFRAVGGLHDPVALLRQRGDDRVAHQWFVFDQQDRLAAHANLWQRNAAGRTAVGGVGHGKIDFKSGAEPQLAVDFDVPAALFDDSINRGQAQSRAGSNRLGGEKRFEDMGAHVVGHAGAGVADAQHGIGPHGGLRVNAQRNLGPARHWPFRSRSAPPCGIASRAVHRQVHHDLRQLRHVDHDVAQVPDPGACTARCLPRWYAPTNARCP